MINKVGVCVSGYDLCIKIETALYDFFNDLSCNVEVDILSSGEECLRQISQNIEYNLLILDLDDINGLEIGKSIRKDNKQLKIAFVSSVERYDSKIFQVEPCGLLLKPISVNKIRDMVEGVLIKKSYSHAIFQYDYRKKRKQIRFNHILYFMSNNKHVEIHCVEGKNEKFVGKLTDICDNLPAQFIRISQSCIVNRNHVIEFGSSSVRLINNMFFNVSKPYREDYRMVIYKND